VPIDRPAALRNAERFLRLGRLEEAIAEYRSVLDDQPLDWNTANALGDLYVRAGQLDQAVAHFVRTADTLAREGFVVRASALYKKILKFRPDHEYSLLRAAEIATNQGLMADARACLSSIVERRRARGDHAGVAEMTIQLASLDPADYQARAAGARARVYLGDVGGALNDLLQLAADAVSRGNPSDAIVVLREATGLEPGNLDVRARVADAYLAAGDVAQARRLAVTAHQFAAVGVAFEAAGRPDEALESWREGARLYPTDLELLRHLGGRPPHARDAELVVDTGDVRALIRTDSPGSEGAVATPSADHLAEVDLSLELETIGRADAPEVETGGASTKSEGAVTTDLEEIFEQIRDRAGRRSGDAAADEAFQRGVSLHEAGRDDEALAALQEATRAPHRRFGAASLAGRIVRDRGQQVEAVEWFERAAQAPAATREEGHALLLDLADALESIGEVARALAVCLELRADAGDFREITARVQRLSKRQARE